MDSRYDETKSGGENEFAGKTSMTRQGKTKEKSVFSKMEPERLSEGKYTKRLKKRKTRNERFLSLSLRSFPLDPRNFRDNQYQQESQINEKTEKHAEKRRER